MVNANRVKNKLPSLLINGPSSCDPKAKKFKKENWKKLMRLRYRLGKLRETNPEKYNTLMNNHIAVLTEIENAINL